MNEKNYEFNDWLTCRFPVDARSRSKVLESEFARICKQNRTLTLLDIGSGNGASVMHFWSLFKMDQVWYLLEQESQLIKNGMKTLLAFFAKIGNVEVSSDQSLKIKLQDITIDIHYIKGSINEIQTLGFPVSQVSVVTAHAVLDILPPDTMNHLLKCCCLYGWVFYAPMNYVEMSFSPSTDIDKTIIQKYEQHMFESGNLANRATDYATVFANRETAKSRIEVSTWNLSTKDGDLLRFLIRFMSEAVLEQEMDVQEVLAWKIKKLDMISKGELEATVDHRDLLIQFNPSLM